ncbi:MAG: cysteine desulfurase-like protein [Proteobacteria bacterium]|nr:cysteine desulfurase-like protein [Pseudomonadota bacterium]
MAFDPIAARAQFPSLAVADKGVRRIYLDNPAGTQVPLSVVQRMSDCLLHGNANLGGFFRTSDLAAEFVDDARAASADFLNASSVDEIIFGQNMTTLTLHLSRSIGRHLNAGDEIVLSNMDHDANIAPWLLLARDHGLNVRWLKFNTESFEFDTDALDKALTERTKLVCVGGASNMTGTLNDLKGLCTKIRAAGAWSFVDAVQSAPHVLVDVQDIGCDFLACSAYKFFGPHQSMLWGRRDILQQLEPYKVRPAPEELPWRFEAGTQSHEGIAGIGAAIDYFADIGGTAGAGGDRRQRLVTAFGRLFAYEKLLAGQLIAGLQAIPGITVQGITDRNALDRRVPTVSFTHARKHPDTIAKALAERNIFVWSGHNYAVEPAKALGIYDTGGVVRIGAVHYNTVAEIDETLAAIEAIPG